MRFTVVLVVLFAIVMATMAKKVNQKKMYKWKKKFQAEKMQRQQQAACEIVTWSSCENGTITQSVSPNTSNPDCKGAIIDSTTISHTMDCVTNITKQFKACKLVISRNFTACGLGEETYNMTKTFDCKKKSHKNNKAPAQRPCGVHLTDTVKMKKGKGKKGKGGGGKVKVNSKRKEKKVFRKKMKQMEGLGCEYQRQSCVGKKMKYTLIQGNQNKCDKELLGPCLGVFRSKKNKARSGRGACKYKSEQWSDCHPVTNMKTKRRVLKRGDPLSCNETMIVEKLCKRKPRPFRESKCKYQKTDWSMCDPVTNEKTMVKTLKSANMAACPPTQTVKKVCKRTFKNKKRHVPSAEKCAYRGVSKWGQCDRATNMRTRQTVLKKGSLKFCKPSTVETKPCKKKRNKPKKGCKYDRNQWTPCNAATNTVTRTLTLKEGDPSICNATKTITRKCKDKHLRPHCTLPVCVYRRTTWGECDGASNMVSMVKTLKRGDPSLCEATQTVQRKCKRKKKQEVCKYSKADWSPCDQATNTMTKSHTLTSGPDTCPAMKEFSRKCIKPCKFSQGRWSECDQETQQMTREDTLAKGQQEFCPPKRILTKKCGKKSKKCNYDHGTWSECDGSEKPMRTRVQKLVSGGENCKPEKVTHKSCQKNSGKDRCFFGTWSDYDECKNGVQKKRREVIQGGVDCERKSVKMKPC